MDTRDNKQDFLLLKKMMAEFHQVEKYLLGDFYPLTGYSLDDRAWLAWQYDQPEMGEGMVQAFRHKNSPFETAHFKLRGLDPAGTYGVTNLDTPHTPVKMTGQELIESGLPVTMAQSPQALIFVYKRETCAVN
jgi:alpha-galactosidase